MWHQQEEAVQNGVNVSVCVFSANSSLNINAPITLLFQKIDVEVQNDPFSQTEYESCVQDCLKTRVS